MPYFEALPSPSRRELEVAAFLWDRATKRDQSLTGQYAFVGPFAAMLMDPSRSGAPLANSLDIFIVSESINERAIFSSASQNPDLCRYMAESSTGTPIILVYKVNNPKHNKGIAVNFFRADDAYPFPRDLINEGDARAATSEPTCCLLPLHNEMENGSRVQVPVQVPVLRARFLLFHTVLSFETIPSDVEKLNAIFDIKTFLHNATKFPVGHERGPFSREEAQILLPHLETMCREAYFMFMETSQDDVDEWRKLGVALDFRNIPGPSVDECREREWIATCTLQ